MRGIIHELVPNGKVLAETHCGVDPYRRGCDANPIGTGRPVNCKACLRLAKEPTRALHLTSVQWMLVADILSGALEDLNDASEVPSVGFKVATLTTVVAALEAELAKAGSQ